MKYQDYDVPPVPVKLKAGAWWKTAIAVVGVLAIAAGVIGTITLNSINAAAEATASASASASASRSAEASAKAKAQAELDKSIKDLAAAMEKSVADAAREDRVAMEKNGWKYVSDYLYYATPTEHFTCPGRYGCASFVVTTSNQPDGCPSGLSVNVSFLAANGLSVYSSVRSTGTLHTGEQAQLDFTDISGNGASFRVDSMRCY